MTISAVIHVFNERDFIEPCLKSLGWVDEIVIIDQGGSDGGIEICKSYTQRIVPHPPVPVVEMARNFGIEQASGDWILVLDPDERVSGKLASTLRDVSESSSADAYSLARSTWIFGREIRHTGWNSDSQVRFFKRGKVRWPQQVHSLPEIAGVVASIDASQGCIVHENYVSLTQFLDKLNRYTTDEALRLRRENRPFHFLKLFYQPAREFFSRFIKCKGYKDGFVGFLLSLLMAFYWQMTYMKLWESYDIEKRSNPDQADELGVCDSKL